MNAIQVWWYHFKIQWAGDPKFEKDGGGIIPCRKCGRMFQSYMHFSGGFDGYDSLCEWCEFKMKDPLELKKAVEQILTDYNSKVKSWDTAKAYLRSEGFKIRFTPHRCAWMQCELKGDEPTLGEILVKTKTDSWGSLQAQKLLIDHNFKPTDKLCRGCFRLV